MFFLICSRCGKVCGAAIVVTGFTRSHAAIKTQYVVVWRYATLRQKKQLVRAARSIFNDPRAVCLEAQ